MLSDKREDIVFGTERLGLEKIINCIVNFINNHISEFPQWLMNSDIEFLSKEDTLNFNLSKFLNTKYKYDSSTNSDFNMLLSFTNQPTQPYNNYKPDIEVSLCDDNRTSSSIFYIECKRLPARKGYNREYVEGKCGGIQRFKENNHGKELSHSAMVAYIQRYTINEWITKINSWIEKLIRSNNNSFWNEQDKIIEQNNRFISKNSRIDNTPITLYHFWIDLT